MTMPSHAMEEHDLLTIAEIARQFSLPESTARFYCKRFMDYLPHVGEGKRRRYRRKVLDVFAVILAEIHKRKNANAVEAVLAARFPRNIEPDEALPQPQRQDNGNALTPVSGNAPAFAAGQQLMAVVEAQGLALGQIANALTRLADREEEIIRLRKKLEQSEDEVHSLRSELADLRTLQDTSEKMHQEDLEQLRKWMGHLASEQARKK